jgi:hypothetical protein
MVHNGCDGRMILSDPAIITMLAPRSGACDIKKKLWLTDCHQISVVVVVVVVVVIDTCLRYLFEQCCAKYVGQAFDHSNRS